MRRRHGQGGAALLWAVTAMTLVTLAVAAVASGLARQAGAVRRLQAAADLADLQRSVRAWEAAGVVVGDRLELAGGTIELVEAQDGSTEWSLLVRGARSSERWPRP